MRLLHLHLGVDFENNGNRVSRSGRVLIAKFECNSAYLIDVVNHGRGYPSIWGYNSHLEIIYRNWPSILGKEIPRQFAGEEDAHSASECIELRNSGINIPTSIDGKYFACERIAADGSLFDAGIMSLCIHEELTKAETELRKNEPLAKSFLVLKNDYSIGFLTPKKNKEFCYSKIPKNNKVTKLFHRLLLEIPLATDKSYNQFITPKRIKY